MLSRATDQWKRGQFGMSRECQAHDGHRLVADTTVNIAGDPCQDPDPARGEMVSLKQAPYRQLFQGMQLHQQCHPSEHCHYRTRRRFYPLSLMMSNSVMDSYWRTAPSPVHGRGHTYSIPIGIIDLQGQRGRAVPQPEETVLSVTDEATSEEAQQTMPQKMRSDHSQWSA